MALRSSEVKPVPGVEDGGSGGTDGSLGCVSRAIIAYAGQATHVPGLLPLGAGIHTHLAGRSDLPFESSPSVPLHEVEREGPWKQGKRMSGDFFLPRNGGGQEGAFRSLGRCPLLTSP